MSHYFKLSALLSERSQCFIEGGFGIVNISYGDFYFGALDSPFSGRVGICQNGLYSSVCDVNWDENDATAFCNSLGIGGIFGENMLAEQCLTSVPGVSKTRALSIHTPHAS